MVRVKAPLMSMSAQKQLGHSLIYKQKGSRSFVTGYNKPGGKNPSPASATQKNKRMIYNLIIARWQTFTDEQKAVYNDLVKAKNLNMSGWNYFYQQSLTDLPTYLGLVGYWSFNEIVGGKILDLSGNGNDGTLLPSYPTNYPPLVNSLGKKFGQAGSFDGVDDRVNCGDGGGGGAFNLTDKGSIELWFKPRVAFSGGSNVSTLMLASGCVSNLYFSSQSSRLFFFLDEDAASCFSDSGSWKNEWYNLVVSSNGILLKMYINGVLQANTGDASLGNFFNLGENFIISTTANGFNGLIDEVKIYDRALSANEVLKHYELISKK